MPKERFLIKPVRSVNNNRDTTKLINKYKEDNKK